MPYRITGFATPRYRSKLGIMWWTILAVVLALVCVVCVLAALVWPGRFGPSD